MSVSERGLALIREFEGLRLDAYPDPGTGGRPWTIGYGHTTGVEEGQRCTTAEAEAWLREDADHSARAVLRHVTAPLTQGQLDALTSFVFNLGEQNLAKSTLTKKLNAGDFVGAQSEFQRWNQAAGKVMPGLTRRRAAEAALFGDSISSQPQVQEQPMAPFIAAALPAILHAVPELVKMFGSGSEVAERNAKAAETVVQIAQAAVGASNAQEAAETIAANPESAQAARTAILEQWYSITEAGGGGIAGAREYSLEVAKEGIPPWRLPSFWMTVMLLPLIYMVIGSVVFGTGWSDDVRAGTVSAVISGVMFAIVGYWLGSSAGSAKKTEMLDQDKK